jgi:hypothetical protein
MNRLLIVLLMLLGGCLKHEKPPPIAENMGLSIANKEWPPRLVRRFPPGTPEAQLLRTLQEQGFAIDTVKRTAKADWTTGVCNNEVDIVWQVDVAGKVTTIGGRYFPVCP